MILEPHETQRFYRIWFQLLHYVNEKLALVPELPASPADGSIEAKDAYQVSSALWAMDNDTAWNLLDFLRHYER